MMWLSAVAMAAATPAPAPAAAAPESTVSFELSNGRIFVDAFVNGRGPYRFGFDTGAGGTGRADVRLAAAASLPKVDQAEASDAITTATVDVVAAKSLRVGTLEKRDVELLSRDYNRSLKPGQQPMMGIIGRDFFADRLVTIDYPRRTITFAHGELRRGEAGVVPYDGSFVIPVCFASGCHDGKVDTGSNRGLVVPKGIVGELQASDTKVLDQVRRTNSVATLYEMTLREPVRVGPITAAVRNVLYTEPSDTVINIGSDFLKDYVLTIDQRNRLLRIGKPAG